MLLNAGAGRRKSTRPGLLKPRMSCQLTLRACASATERWYSASCAAASPCGSPKSALAARRRGRRPAKRRLPDFMPRAEMDSLVPW